MKKFSVITAAVLAAAMMTGCGASSKVAIQGGDVKVTKGDLSLLVDAYTTRFGDFDAAKEQAVETIEAAVKEYALFKAKGLELTEDEQMQLKQGKANFARTFGGTTAYKNELKKKGASEEFVEMVIAEPLYQAKLAEETQLEEADDAALLQYFKDNYRRATHVLLTTETEEDKDLIKERAEDILARANKGEDFDEMVKNFSEDPGSQSNPEGYVFTDGEMVDEFDDAVKSLKPGEVTLCESDYGYHVVKRLPLAENDEKLKELFEQYKETVRSKKATADTKEAIDKMAEEAGITVETVDSVIESIASPQPEATEATEEATADPEE